MVPLLVMVRMMGTRMMNDEGRICLDKRRLLLLMAGTASRRGSSYLKKVSLTDFAFAKFLLVAPNRFVSFLLVFKIIRQEDSSVVFSGRLL